jgi:pyochelin biosynthetic protein PchC
VCLPHAGGTAGFFRTWAAELPPDVELHCVQYPGREDRLNEPLVDDMGALADAVSGALVPLLDRPVALFGHSLGAAVAYEVAQRIQRHSVAEPVALFLSGRPGPRHERGGSVHLATDEVLVDELGRLDGTGAPVLAHPALMRLILPIVRNDYRLSETYRPASSRVDCAVVACLGANDSEVTTEEALGWQEVTSGAFDCWAFPGGHFYLNDQRAALLARISARLAAVTTP